MFLIFSKFIKKILYIQGIRVIIKWIGLK